MNHLVYLKDEGVNAVSPEFARRFATVKAHFFSRNPDLWPVFREPGFATLNEFRARGLAPDARLNAWPDGPNSDEARARLDYLWTTDEGAWIRARRLNSPGGYADFLRAYPRSPYAIEARRVLDEYRRQDDYAWDRARRRDSIGEYERYIRDYSDGYHRRDAERRNQRLRLRPTDLWVTSDPLLLERILHNLISNALRYAPGGTVLVACRRRGTQVTLEVRDNGPGIAPDAQEAIFHEFVQLDNPERNRAKGLGLGLAIVRRLTTLLGHPLRLRSAPGRGALFSVTLPVTVPRPQDHNPPSAAAHSLTGLHVALIDDDPLAAASTLTLLESWGCLVTAADTLERMYAALQSSEMPPDIVLCDHHLDGALDGVAVVARLRQRLGTDLRAIILSSDTTLADSPRVRASGIRVLHKPVRPARLRALLQRKTGS